MIAECNQCGFKEKGSYKKLLKKGWCFYFFKEKGMKVCLCQKHKPRIKDKIKLFFDSKYQSEMNKEIEQGFNKIKILYQLKESNEKHKDKIDRAKKIIRKRKYHNRMQGSKSRRFSLSR